MKNLEGQNMQYDIKETAGEAVKQLEAMGVNIMQVAEAHRGTATKVLEPTIKDEQTCMCQGDVFKSCAACACGSGGGCRRCCGCGHAKELH